ncbi:uncharacterized protein TNCV_1273361 [Trichonephila clavipes]|nr:uncharacterized protein TNCV_1273361 [Trichonephila clavipes]
MICVDEILMGQISICYPHRKIPDDCVSCTYHCKRGASLHGGGISGGIQLSLCGSTWETEFVPSYHFEMCGNYRNSWRVPKTTSNRDYIRPLRREKKNDNWSSPRWSVSVSRTANLVGVSRTIVPKAITAYTNLCEVSSVKHKRGQKTKLKDRERRVLKRIVTQKCKTTLPRITYKMNIHLQNPVSMKTIQRELHAAGIHGRLAILKASV